MHGKNWAFPAFISAITKVHFVAVIPTSGSLVEWCGCVCCVEWKPSSLLVYEAKRNHQIETFHSLWVEAFWSRHVFTDIDEVRSHTPRFSRWYHHHYRPRDLQGKTPVQMRYGVQVPKLTTALRRLIPDFHTQRLPITAGR